jgi:hypothetical protein
MVLRGETRQTMHNFSSGGRVVAVWLGQRPGRPLSPVCSCVLLLHACLSTSDTFLLVSLRRWTARQRDWSFPHGFPQGPKATIQH